MPPESRDALPDQSTRYICGGCGSDLNGLGVGHMCDFGPRADLRAECVRLSAENEALKAERDRLRGALLKLADPNTDTWDRYTAPHRHTVRFASAALQSDENGAARG